MGIMSKISDLYLYLCIVIKYNDFVQYFLRPRFKHALWRTKYILYKLIGKEMPLYRNEIICCTGGYLIKNTEYVVKGCDSCQYMIQVDPEDSKSLFCNKKNHYCYKGYEAELCEEFYTCKCYKVCKRARKSCKNLKVVSPEEYDNLLKKEFEQYIMRRKERYVQN